MEDFAQRRHDLISELALIQDEKGFAELEKTVQRILRRNSGGGTVSKNGKPKIVSQRKKKTRKNGTPIPQSAEAILSNAIPIAEKIDLEKTMQEQGYRGPDRARFKKFARELDIPQPIEELLAGLTK